MDVGHKYMSNMVALIFLFKRFSIYSKARTVNKPLLRYVFYTYFKKNKKLDLYRATILSNEACM